MAMIALIFISMAIVFSIGTSAVAASPYNIYVNNAGNDSWDGQYATWNGTSGPKLTIKNATATVASNGTIHIANGTYNENGISVSNKNVNFAGENRDSTIINGGKTGRIFTVGAQGVTYKYSFTNLTFINGNSTSGGAIWNYGSTTITNCAFKNNTATYSGGAIINYGTGSAPGSYVVTDSYFSGNRVTSGNGGAIYNGGLGPVSVTNCDFTDNTVSGTGGVLYNSLGSTSTIQFSRIIGTGNSLIAFQSGSPAVDASLNWWGSNADPTSKVQSGVIVGPWLVLTGQIPVSLSTGSNAIIMADLQHDSDGIQHDPAYGHVPDGIPVTFAGDALGSVSPLSGTTINGLLMTNFTAGLTTSLSNPTFTVDSETVSADVNIADRIPSSITVDPVSGHYGDLVDLTATLTDTQNNQPISDALLDFYLNGSYLGSAMTDINGLATVPYYYISQGAGIYQILVQFIGDTATTYSGSSGTNNLTVNLIPTSITVTNPASGYYGDQVDLTATLTDSNSQPIIGTNVYFSANGNPLGVAVTDTNGVVTLHYTIAIGAGNYPVLAQFMGDSIYDSSSATSALTVNKVPTSLTVDPKSVNYNSWVYLTAVLKDNIHNINLSGKTISFYLDGNFAGNTTTGSLYLSPVTLTPGIHEISAQFAGDTGYLPSSGTNTLTVNKVPTSITVVPKTGYYNDIVNLNATLRNIQTSAVLSGKSVDFYVNGNLIGSATTNASGIAILPYTITLPSGSYQILAQFAGDSTYNATNGTSTLTVNLTPTNITVNSQSGYHNDVVNLVAALKDNPHNVPLSGATVNFSVGGVSVGSAVTDANGIATLAYTITQGAGNYSILAQFGGNTSYAACNATNNLTVSAVPTSIAVNPLSGYYGDAVNLIATLTDTHNNVPVNRATVNFTVNGTSIGTATTNASGMAIMPYTIALTAGTYQILAEFLGNTSYSSSFNVSSMIVNHIPTSLIINPVSGNNGDVVNLIAKLTDLHNNIPVSGKTVNFTVNGGSVGSAVTDANGIATLPYTIALNIGNYLVLAQFVEDTTYSGSTGTTALTVNATPVKIVVDAVNGIKGSQVSLTSTLTDTHNNVPLSGKTVNFSVNGSSVGSAVTDSNGVATYLYTITQNTGVYQILAQFAEDNIYPSVSGTNNLIVPDTIAPSVTVSPAGGLFNTNQLVTLTTTDPDSTATTYYTTDGSDPKTSATRKVYSNPVTISTTTTLRFAAVDPAGLWSPNYTQK